MEGMFRGCSSLLFLPDISKWDTSNLCSIADMFFGCSSLSNLPDISKWNDDKITSMSNMLYQCSNIVISKLIKYKFKISEL